MKIRPTARGAVLGASLAGLVLAWTSCTEDASFVGWSETPFAPASTRTVVEIAAAPLSDEVFPCSDCHDPDVPSNTRRRKLRIAHEEIELRHLGEERWCMDCHDTEDSDMLRLANGEHVPFEESYRLCAQCHGAEYRDWQAGGHGRRTGNWNGKQTSLQCALCHDAHAPQFGPLEPMPPPVAPERTR